MGESVHIIVPLTRGKDVHTSYTAKVERIQEVEKGGSITCKGKMGKRLLLLWCGLSLEVGL
jgi:hypothetical protein